MKHIAGWILLLLMAVSVAGCHKAQSAGGKTCSACSAAAAPSLAESQVLETAKKVVAERGLNLAEYKISLPYFDPTQGTWFVLFEHVPNRRPGDHSSVFVDDRTGKGRFVGGQ